MRLAAAERTRLTVILYPTDALADGVRGARALCQAYGPPGGVSAVRYTTTGRTRMMKRNAAIAAPALVLGLLISGDARAQGGPRAAGRLYDPKTGETITGMVESLDRVPSAKGRVGGVHVLVRTDGETVPVHLGPSWYVDGQDVKIGRGDRVEVRGSRVTVSGKAALIAAEVKKGDQVLRLRDERGVPHWSGRRGP
jgi:hypothetical protein